MMIKNLKKKTYLFYYGDPSVKGSIGYLESLPRGRLQFEVVWSREELNANLQYQVHRYYGLLHIHPLL